jgi:hypothetical protein
VPGSIDPAALAADVATEPLGVELPGAAGGLRFEARVVTPEPEAAEAMEVRMWLRDAVGTPAVVPLDVTVAEADGALALTADHELPPGESPWRVVAVEVAQGRGWLAAELVLTGMHVLSTGDSGGSGTELVEPVPNVRLHPGAPGRTGVRSAMVWTAGGATPPRIPAVVTATFAEQLGLTEGDDVDVRFDGEGRTVAATVAAIVTALPSAGTGAGVLVSLDAAVDAASAMASATEVAGDVVTPPLADEVWAAGDEAAAPALGDALGAPVATVGSAASAVAGEVVTLWDAAALGGALLAGVALVALLAALTSQRAGEVLVLRALGVAPTAQARMRGVEATVVVVLGALLGAAGGVLLAALLVPRMAERAIPDVQLPPSLAFAPWPIVTALVAIGIALAVAVLGSSAAVRRQGASTRIEEAAP